MLRISLSLAASLGQSIRVTGIRASRMPSPGLRPQHLGCVRVLELLSRGCKTEGADIGSQDLAFLVRGGGAVGKRRKRGDDGLGSGEAVGDTDESEDSSEDEVCSGPSKAPRGAAPGTSTVSTLSNAAGETARASETTRFSHPSVDLLPPVSYSELSFKYDIGSAGSIALLFQAALPAMLFATRDREASSTRPSKLAAPTEHRSGEPDIGTTTLHLSDATGTGARGDPNFSTVEQFKPPPASETLVSLRVAGGTDVPLSPPLDYVSLVLLPTLKALFGIDARLDVFQRGFLPAGGGDAKLTVRPLRDAEMLSPAAVPNGPGEAVAVVIRSFVAGSVPNHVAERAAKAAEEVLLTGKAPQVPNSDGKKKGDRSQSRGHFPPDFPIDDLSTKSLKPLELHPSAFSVELAQYGSSQGSLGRDTAGANDDRAQRSTARLRPRGDATGITVAIRTTSGCVLGGSRLGARGIPAEALGAQAAWEALSALRDGASVDRATADQIVVFAALASGETRIPVQEPTTHARVAAETASLVAGTKAEFLEEQGRWVFECRGVGK